MKAAIRHRLGFTLVELLIVIVVIAILAAISVVAYNGIQERSQATRAITIANSYIKLLKMYHVENGRYPIVPDDTCLGDASDFPASSPYPAGVCLHRKSGDHTSTSTSLMNSLRVYGSLPNSLLQSVSYSSNENWRGIRYHRSSSNGQATLEWIVKGGSQSCGAGTAYPSGAYTYCYLAVPGSV